LRRATRGCRHEPAQRGLASAPVVSDRGAADGCSYAASSSATPFRLVGFVAQSGSVQDLWPRCDPSALVVVLHQSAGRVPRRRSGRATHLDRQQRPLAPLHLRRLRTARASPAAVSADRPRRCAHERRAS